MDTSAEVTSASRAGEPMEGTGKPMEGTGEPMEGTRKPTWPSTPLGDCQRMVSRSLERNMTVKFMTDKLAEAGCKVDPSFITVEHCPEEVGGGFRPSDGVVICHNHLGSQQEIDNALIHELVHAYDHCRAANLDWNNCEHHACSEIRAASLSGDCTFKQEFLRGNWAIKGQHQVCVKRRAELSVAMNPSCTGPRARAAIDKVYDVCFNDTAPFDRRP